MTQVKFRSFHTGEPLISQWSIPLNVLFSISASLVGRWSENDHRGNSKQSTTGRFKCFQISGCRSCEEATVSSRVIATLTSLAISCREWRLAGCRVEKACFRVLGRSSCSILRSNVVNCSCVDPCSIDLSPLLTSHLYRLVHVCLTCFCYYIWLYKYT